MEGNGHGPVELYRKHRPARLSDVVGQPLVVKAVKQMLLEKKVPHALLLTGPSGTGKSTTAYILKDKLGCGDLDFFKCNCAESADINAIRDMIKATKTAPFKPDGCKVFLLEEAQAMSRVHSAQQCLLDVLENVPDHVYFILATTDHDKLLRAIVTRCHRLQFRSLQPKDQKEVLRRILETEYKGRTLNPKVESAIIDNASGSARQAVQLLQKAMGLGDLDDQLEAVADGELKHARSIFSLLLSPQTRWEDIAKYLTEEEVGDVERLRMGILEVARKKLLESKAKSQSAVRAYHIYTCFKDPWYSCGPVGLVGACYEVFGMV